MTDSNFRNYSRRNAFAAAVDSLVKSHAKHDQVEMVVVGKFETYTKSRVETSEWMYGFTMDCSGLDRRAEDNIVGEARALFPRLRIEVVRKSKNYPRHIKFSF